MQNFEELSDYDFARLVADLLSAHWRVDVDTFPRGRDGGVDLRVLGPTGVPLRLEPATNWLCSASTGPTPSCPGSGPTFARKLPTRSSTKLPATCWQPPRG